MSFVNSPVHDLLIRIKNAYMARKTTVDNVFYSNFKKEILKLLERYNFIESFKEIEIKKWRKEFQIKLHATKDVVNDIPVVKFYSKSSRRWYVGWEDIKLVAWGRWIWIISTNKWLMASHEAKSKRLWWELIAEIY